MKDGQPDPAEIDPGSEPDRSPSLSDDRLYRALAATRRRRLVYTVLVEEESTIVDIATVLDSLLTEIQDTDKHVVVYRRGQTTALETRSATRNVVVTVGHSRRGVRTRFS